ncbi:MAG: M48 family metallopeptidase [Candidatus Omnitrophica bacterium]|nr:M48 family metallopeptidase [Candidatus Omnitrophota bacterium]
MKKIFIPLSLLLGLFLTGCATYYNPVTGKQEETFYTEKDEIDMGIALDKKICSEFKIVEDPDKVFSGFTTICTRIAANNDRPHLPYKFKVIEKNEVNAFSIPGGFVYVYTGLLKQIDSPDELACVIGHEVAHICNRDAVHRLEKQILYSIPASILFGSGRQKAIQQAVDAIFSISMLKYSRTQEIQADTLGMTYAFRAGFDPEGMISFFRKMQELEKKQPSLPLTFLSDHPNAEQRIQNARIVISRLKEKR